MDFSDVINDLIKLEGIRLNSIRPGAEIIIKQVDVVQKKVIVESSSGKLQSRSFSEFQRIWEALLSSPAIRVEEVLNGSGSSRNQPDTIFANLPYIQWLKIDSKKHIAYTGKASHPYGTIQQMDSIYAAQIAVANEDSSNNKAIILIVADDIADSSDSIKKLTGAQGKASQEGYYVYNLTSQTIVLADTIRCNLPCGTYVECFSVTACPPQHTVSFLGYTWAVFTENNLKIIVRR